MTSDKPDLMHTHSRTTILAARLAKLPLNQIRVGVVYVVETYRTRGVARQQDVDRKPRLYFLPVILWTRVVGIVWGE